MNHPTLFDLGGNLVLGGEQPPAPAKLPDITRRKHGGNPQSELANQCVHQHKAGLREKVLNLISQSGSYGMTLKELCAVLSKPMHSLSGRVSELKQAGKIRGQLGTRDGCAILEAKI